MAQSSDKTSWLKFACPELIWIENRVPALGQMWLVEIVPNEYTTHTLLSKLKIFTLALLMVNLQYTLILFVLTM